MVAFSAPAFGQTGWAIEREFRSATSRAGSITSPSTIADGFLFVAELLALGNRSNIGAAGAIGRQSAKDKAAAFSSNVMPVVSSVQAAGVTTLSRDR